MFREQFVSPDDCLPEDLASDDEDSESDDDMVGTTFYMAPEAVADESASYATDLWALGVIIYQMITCLLYTSDAADDLTRL